MKKKKIRLLSILIVVGFLLISVSNVFLLTKSYAQDKGIEIYYLAESKPKSGGFSSSKSSSSKSYSKPKTSTIKPDSGSFSASPNKSSNKSNSKSSTKPDSGNFSTKPKTDKKTNNESKANNNESYDNYPKSNKRIFRGRSYGYSNPFYGMMYGFRRTSWITKLVIAITVIVIIYIAIDYIRSRRD